MPQIRLYLQATPGRRLDLRHLRQAMEGDGWRDLWRPRALDGVILHDAVPGLAAGPGYELLGDRRGPGWLELHRAETAADPAAILQCLLEVTRRPWGVLALLAEDAGAPARLVEAAREPALGRRLAADAAVNLLRTPGRPTGF